MRTLLGPEGDLREVYAAPETPWLRVNMVSTIDGAATGESGLTASINNEPDQRVFRLLRELADCVVVGAGTARTEGYPPLDVPLVVVSRSGQVPEALRDAEPGRVLLATCSHARRTGRGRARSWETRTCWCSAPTASTWRSSSRRSSTAGSGTSSARAARTCCATCSTRASPTRSTARSCRGWSPASHPRITDGPPVDVSLRLHTLVEEDGTLLGRWFTGS